MKPINFNYLNDLSEETIELAKESKQSPRFCNHVTVPCSSFSPTDSEYLTVLGAEKGKWKITPIIRLRVLTRSGGMTVTIIYHDIMESNYRSLRNYLRNRQQVQITFPDITVNCSSAGFGLFFTATDFKIKPFDSPSELTS